MQVTSWYRRGITAFGALALVVAAGTASAQQSDRRDMRQQDRRENKQDTKQSLSNLFHRDPTKDLTNAVAKLDQAKASGDRNQEKRWRDKINSTLQHSISDARNDLAHLYHNGNVAAMNRGHHVSPRVGLRQAKSHLSRLTHIDRRLREIAPAAQNHDRNAMREESRLDRSFVNVTRVHERERARQS